MDRKLITPDGLKASDEGAGTLSGYASTFSNWDSVGERPVKGAFQRHLGDFLSDGFIAIGHDWSALPVATPVEAYEDDHGLFVKAAFHSTPEAQAARTVVKERLERGKSVKLSIGYEVLDDQYTNEGRLLKDVKLFEYSIVTVPANTQASVTDAKLLPRDGMTAEQHTTALLAELDVWTNRVRAMNDMRAKEGRVLSDANRKRIASLLEALTAVQNDLGDLLAASEPKANPSKAMALYLEFQHLETQLHGALT